MTSPSAASAPGPVTVRTGTAEATRRVARAVAGCLRAGDLVVLDGPLGAGKTTFTQGLGDALGVRGPIASPTFVIARVHPSLRGGPALVHVDAYRLTGAFDVEDLDLDAQADESVTVAEWGRDRVEHLAASHLLIELERPAQAPTAAGDDTEDVVDEPRTLTLTGAGERWNHAEMTALAEAVATAVDEES